MAANTFGTQTAPRIGCVRLRARGSLARHVVSFRLAAVTAVAMFAGVACGDGATNPEVIANCVSPGPAIVGMENFGFHPQTIRVRPGATVTWVNCEPEGREAHTSTSDAAVWQSPLLTRGQEFSHTFEVTGRFDYHCVPHPAMRGVVIVE